MERQKFELALATALRSLRIAGGRVLVGISGGADSVALLHALVRFADSKAAWPEPGPHVVAAHLDHQLRGAESAADATWVRGLCQELGVPLVEQQIDVRGRADTLRCGLEQAARDARYEFLSQTAREQHCAHVLVAHTADDQAETVLHRMLRGTGLDGLRGIPQIRPLTDGVTLARPLLDVRRAEIEAYLRAVGQDWRCDSTNLDVSLTRNRIRHELLPGLRDRYNPQVDAALIQLARQAAEVQAVVDQFAEELLADCCLDAGLNAIRLDASTLENAPEHLVREVLKRMWVGRGWPLAGMGYDEWNAAARVARGESAAADLPGGVRAERRGTLLAVSRRG